VNIHVLRVAALATLVASAAACSRSLASDPRTPGIHMTAPAKGPAYIEYVGLSDKERDALANVRYSLQQWSEILHVSVFRDGPPLIEPPGQIIGRYEVVDDTVRFTPAFPFDPGRTYNVWFNPTRIPGASSIQLIPSMSVTVSLPRPDIAPSTVVTHVYPSGDFIPENQLRMYIEFSAPMGRRSGIDYVALLDENGKQVEGPFLPLDYEFWNADRTRFTVFFDPGRVKNGILPNKQMGRALKVGKSYTLLVRSEWQDANGLPLKESFRRTFRVGPPDTRPLDTAQWRIEPPKAGAQTPLVVAFPEPVDHGLLFRALGVRRSGEVVDGDVTVGANETQWSFTPHQPWEAGDYSLLALSILEDRAGNQIGRAFEVDNFESVDKGSDPRTVTLPFHVTR
jgi:hypothetical protein